MRILFLTPDLPVPPDQGGKLRNLALIRAAAAHHQVDVLSFTAAALPALTLPHQEGGNGSGPHPNPLPEGEGTGGLPAGEGSVAQAEGAGAAEVRSPQSPVLDVCRRVVTVEAPPPRAFLPRAWGLWFDQIPDVAHRRESSPYHTALWELLEHERYDVVQIEGLEMMPYLGTVRAAAPRAAVIYDAHNAEMTLQRTIWQTELRDPRRWHGAGYSFLQWSKLGTYERVMMNATDMVIAVSEADAARLKGRHVDPEVVPNGVDTAAIAFRERIPPLPNPPPPGGRERGTPTLLFVGPLDYRPNADAARWLVGSIFPAVRARRPEAQLRLVGRGAERLKGAGVEAVGYVEDFGAELAGADVLVVPMRMGSGVRFKVLEAMAAGVPVVSTPLGLSGITAEPEQHALVARSGGEMAAAVLRILEDGELVRRLAIAARRLVETRYDWSKITPGYLRLLGAARRNARAAR